VSNKIPAWPRSSSRSRQPFASRDPNHEAHKQRSSSKTRAKQQTAGREGVNVEMVVKSAVTAVTGCTSQGPSTAGVPSCFKIYDESSEKKLPAVSREWKESRDAKPQSVPRSSSRTSSAASWQKSPPLTEEALVRQTRALTIDTKPSFRSNATTAASSVVGSVVGSVVSNLPETDADVLQHMVDHLDTVISVTESRKGSYRSMPVRPLSPRRGPAKWVTRYVDYTSKYGLGFLLNDGSSGVYFNDSTKTALEPDGDTFQYVERKKMDDSSLTKRRGDTIVETHSLEHYPESLKKKVTLLKHFRNYLLQQQEADDLAEQQRHALAAAKDASLADLVYVKKWVRTKHAILFSLSNRTVQVIFYDQTEILLTPDVAFLTYVDKQRGRSTYSFTDELVGSSPEIAKRLNYTKEILHSLLSKS